MLHLSLVKEDDQVPSRVISKKLEEYDLRAQRSCKNTICNLRANRERLPEGGSLISKCSILGRNRIIFEAFHGWRLTCFTSQCEDVISMIERTQIWFLCMIEEAFGVWYQSSKCI